MAHKHPDSDAGPDRSTVASSRRLPLLAGAVVLILVCVAGAFVFLRGDVVPPVPMPALAIAAGESAPAARPEPAPPTAPPRLTLSKGDIPLLQSLQERQARLEAGEQQLQQRQHELQLLQQQLEERLTTLHSIRQEIAALIAERDSFEEKRFAHLVKVYEGMKPAEAASLVERLRPETAVKLFYRMKGRKVSQILEFVKPDVAAGLSERLAVFQQLAQPTDSKEQ